MNISSQLKELARRCYVTVDIPDDWIKQMFNRYLQKTKLTELNLKVVLKTLKTLKQRLKDQKRHQGGNKWIGTSELSIRSIWI